MNASTTTGLIASKRSARGFGSCGGGPGPGHVRTASWPCPADRTDDVCWSVRFFYVAVAYQADARIRIGRHRQPLLWIFEPGREVSRRWVLDPAGALLCDEGAWTAFGRGVGRGRMTPRLQVMVVARGATTGG